MPDETVELHSKSMRHRAAGEATSHLSNPLLPARWGNAPQQKLLNALIKLLKVHSSQDAYSILCHTLAKTGYISFVVALEAQLPTSGSPSAETASCVFVAAAVPRRSLLRCITRAIGRPIVGYRAPLHCLPLGAETFSLGEARLTELGSDNLLKLFSLTREHIPPRSVRQMGAGQCLTMPLPSPETPTALLVIGDDLYPSDLPFFRWLMRYLYVVTSTTHLVAMERRRHAEAELLSTLAMAINSTRGLYDLLDLVVHRIRDLYQATACSVSLLDATGGNFVLEATTDPSLHTREERIVFPAQHSVAGHAIRERRTLICNDLRRVPEYYGRLAHRADVEQFRSMITAPLIVEDKPLGVIQLLSTQANAFSSTNAETLTTVAGMVASAVARAHSYEHALALAISERRQREIAERLRRVALWVNASLDLDVVLNRILEQLAEVVPYDSASILLLTDGRMEMRAGRGFADPDAIKENSCRINLQDSELFREMSHTRLPIVLDDVWEDKRFILVPGSEQIRSWIGVPLIAQDQVIGMLSVDRYEPGAYNAEDAQTALHFAMQAAIAIENARLHHMVQMRAEELGMHVSARTAELNRVHERMRAVLEQAGEAIVLTAPDGVIEYANPAWERLTGLRVEEAVRNQLRVVSPEHFPELFMDRETLAQRPHVYRRAISDHRQDGSGYTVEATVSPVFVTSGEQSELVNLVVVYRDITERTELERQKNLFISTAAHQLRTPLTSILGFSELLLTRSDLSPEQQQRYLNYIHERAQLMCELVQDLFDVARFEAGARLELHLEPLDIGTLLDNVLLDWQERSPDHRFILETTPGCPLVYVDRARLVNQVLYHLLSNATQYSPPGSTVKIAAKPVGKYVEVIIADTGVGMTADQVRNLFTKFWRADDSPTAVEGSGLGLVVVKHIVEQHGGRIWIDSTPGKGTVVHFTLPQAEPSTVVLIVEDEETMREFEQDVLHTAHIDSLLANDGEEALRMAVYQPDLVLLDLMLPGISGLEVLKALKEDPATTSIPVLVVSALSSWQIIEEVHRLGAVDFLVKPFSPAELIGRVRKALWRQRHTLHGSVEQPFISDGRSCEVMG